MRGRKQPQLQPLYDHEAVDGPVLDAVVVRRGSDEKVLVSRWHLGITKRKFLVQAGIILLAVLCLGVLRLVTWHHDPAGPSARVEDTRALLEYRRDLSRLSSELSDRSRAYQQQSAQAASHRDLIGLFDAANSYEAALKGFAARLDALASPPLANAGARELAASAQSAFKARLARLDSAILLMVEAVDRGEFRPTAFAAMQSALRFSDQAGSRQDAMLKESLALLGAAGQTPQGVR